jgi:transcriptional regulator with XRE-family HTH domain
MKDKELLLELGIKIKLERVRKRLSQEELADLANINPRSVSLIENGMSDVKFLTLTKIANALGMKIELNPK